MAIYKGIVGSVLLLAASIPASAQTFDQAIAFGDSNVDSGFYKALPDAGGGNNFNNDWASAVAHGAGKPTTSPGGMVSEVLASRFGLTAIPSNQPGGTNYASSGAKNVTVNNDNTGGFERAIPTVRQFQNYLDDNGGRVNSNAIYLINSDANDVAFALGTSGNGPFPPNPSAYVINAAQRLAAGIGELHRKGARYIVVPDLPFSFGGGQQRAQRLLYSQTLWSELAAGGVSFIPADTNAVRVAIRDNQAAFGFEFIDNDDPNHLACQFNPASGARRVNGAFALLCSSDPLAPYTFAPGTDQTRLFADEQHLTTAGQKIMADYMYSLIVAPSQISLLPENAVKARTRSMLDIRNQIEVSQRQTGPQGVNGWGTGDISRLTMDNPYDGFPDQEASSPAALVAGADYKWGNGLTTGAAVALGKQKLDFSLGGDFTQHEVSGSLYAAYAQGPFWTNVIGTYGRLNYDVNRLVPIGITVQSNSGETDGHNLSASLQGGYRFTSDALVHGPIAGLTWQRAKVDAFTESGSFTSLSFGRQTRNSLIGELGYRVSAELGNWRPFAQATWNNEINNGGRSVTADLTTVDFAPSYSMPAVALGEDWATVQVGTMVKIAPEVTLLGAFTSEFAQDGVVTYGGQLGINVAF